MRICKKCLKNKKEDSFITGKNICKSCSSKIRKEYYQKNKEKAKLYYENNIDKAKAYYSRNLERIKEYNKEYNRTDKGKRIKARDNKNRRKHYKKGDRITKQDLDNLLKEQDGKCNECIGELDFTIKKSVHLDHIIPISKGGEHRIGNLQWLCQKCNLTKSNRHL